MGEEKTIREAKKKKKGTVELAVAAVRFLPSISLLPNPFCQCSLCTSGPAVLTRPNPQVVYKEILFKPHTHTHTFRRIIFTSNQNTILGVPTLH